MFEYRGLKRLQGKQTAVEKKTKSEIVNKQL